MPLTKDSACVSNKRFIQVGPTNSFSSENCYGYSDCYYRSNCTEALVQPILENTTKNIPINTNMSEICKSSIAAVCDSPKSQKRRIKDIKEKIKRMGLNSPFIQQQDRKQQQMSTSWEYKKWERPAIVDTKTDDEKDEQQYLAPPRFIKISDGKISLGPPKLCDNNKEKEILERRIFELENALIRLQDQLNANKCDSPKLEKDLKDQLENMNRTIKSKERKAMQACREHKMLQARFTRQESILQTLQQENKNLQQRIRQYEHCLDDVMRKVVDAIVAEDSLREEVSMLKGRVRDLEAQNIALSSASPVKGKDEGYCTMSSDQPQPSSNHLEDLPEEPEQWLLPAEPCPTEMEDWSMSQEEFDGIKLDEEHDWIWNSNGYINSTMIDSQSEGISKLLGDTIVYSSDDEEITCIDFTRDFYKLVNIPITGSTRSLHSHMDTKTDNAADDYSGDDDDDDDDDDDNNLSENDARLSTTTKPPSPTPSEAGQAFVTSCSSSESDGQSLQQQHDSKEPQNIIKAVLRNTVVVQPSVSVTSYSTELNSVWRKSNGWKRISKPPSKKDETNKKQSSPLRKSKIPPPVPIRRSYIS